MKRNDTISFIGRMKLKLNDFLKTNVAVSKNVNLIGVIDFTKDPYPRENMHCSKINFKEIFERVERIEKSNPLNNNRGINAMPTVPLVLL